MQILRTDLDGQNPRIQELQEPEKLEDYVTDAVAESASSSGFHVVLGESLDGSMPVYRLFASNGVLVAQNII